MILKIAPKTYTNSIDMFKISQFNTYNARMLEMSLI